MDECPKKTIQRVLWICQLGQLQCVPLFCTKDSEGGGGVREIEVAKIYKKKSSHTYKYAHTYAINAVLMWSREIVVGGEQGNIKFIHTYISL